MEGDFKATTDVRQHDHAGWWWGWWERYLFIRCSFPASSRWRMICIPHLCCISQRGMKTWNGTRCRTCSSYVHMVPSSWSTSVSISSDMINNSFNRAFFSQLNVNRAWNRVSAIWNALHGTKNPGCPATIARLSISSPLVQCPHTWCYVCSLRLSLSVK